MTNKQLEKPITTTDELVQYIIDRYVKKLHRDVAKFKKRFKDLWDEKLPREFWDKTHKYYDELWLKNNTEFELLLYAKGCLYRDITRYRDDNNNLWFLYNAGLMPESQYQKRCGQYIDKELDPLYDLENSLYQYLLSHKKKLKGRFI